MIYVLWKEKHTGNGDHLIFMKKSFLQSFLLYAELREMAKRKKVVIFYSFFNNIWKHQHYKTVLNLYPILWNNYKKFEHTQSENELVSMIEIGPSLETRGKSFEKVWTKWNHRMAKMMKLQTSSLQSTPDQPVAKKCKIFKAKTVWSCNNSKALVKILEGNETKRVSC